MKTSIFIFSCFLISVKTCLAVVDRGIGPVFIWHGLSECDEADSTQRMKRLFESQGSLVKTVRIGDSCLDDTLASYMSLSYQVEQVCNQLSNDPDLVNGFTILGMSQGGLLARALVQMCPTINVITLISAGGPHSGTFGLPTCELLTSKLFKVFCYTGRFLEAAIGQGASGLTPIFRFLSDYAAPACSWIDPVSKPPFYNNTVNQLNNENKVSEDLKDNLLRLNKFIAIYFTNDSSIWPATSAIFDQYLTGTNNVTVPFRETELYKKDLIGLKTLDESGRFIPVASQGLHMSYSNEWFLKNIIDKYLVGQIAK